VNEEAMARWGMLGPQKGAMS
jgi:hypothetical protein